MKRKAIFVLSVVLSLILTSCSYNDNSFETYANIYKARVRIEKILDALKDEDKEALKSMFSKEAIENSENFDENLNAVFEYYEGKGVAIQQWGANLSESSGGSVEELRSSFDVDVESAVGKTYRICFFEVVSDEENPDRVGIWSLYIINFEDDTTITPYYGDGKKSPGVHVAVPRPNDDELSY